MSYKKKILDLNFENVYSTFSLSINCNIVQQTVMEKKRVKTFISWNLLFKKKNAPQSPFCPAENWSICASLLFVLKMGWHELAYLGHNWLNYHNHIMIKKL